MPRTLDVEERSPNAGKNESRYVSTSHRSKVEAKRSTTLCSSSCANFAIALVFGRSLYHYVSSLYPLRHVRRETQRRKGLLCSPKGLERLEGLLERRNMDCHELCYSVRLESGDDSVPCGYAGSGLYPVDACIWCGSLNRTS